MLHKLAPHDNTKSICNALFKCVYARPYLNEGIQKHRGSHKHSTQRGEFVHAGARAQKMPWLGQRLVLHLALRPALTLRLLEAIVTCQQAQQHIPY